MKRRLVTVFFSSFSFLSSNTGFTIEVEYTVPHLREIVHAKEIKYGIPFKLLDSIIWQESSYQIDAFNSSSNEGVAVSSYGLGQLTLDTAEFHCGLYKKYVYKPIRNIDCSARVLKYQLDRYGNKISWAVAAYNWGTPCYCNGKNYQKNIGKRIIPCKRWINKKLNPIKCDKKYVFFNKKYVDEVLIRREKLIKEYNKWVDNIEFIIVKQDKKIRLPRKVESIFDDDWIIPYILFGK